MKILLHKFSWLNRMMLHLSSLPHRYLNFTLIGAIVFLAGANLWYGLDAKMDKLLPHPLFLNISSISIAISEMHYNSSGYIGLRQVFDVLAVNGMDMNLSTLPQGEFFSHFSNANTLNHAISQALNLTNIDRTKTHTIFHNDKGYVDYVKLAFFTFGYNIESLFYLYFSILFLSVTILIVLVRKYTFGLFYIVILLFIHLIVMQKVATVPQLLSVINPRFLPVLGSLIFLGVLTVLISGLKGNWLNFLLVVVCGILFGLIATARSVAMWQLAAASIFLCIMIFRRYIPGITLRRWLVDKPRWPLMAFVIGALLVVGNYRHMLDDFYYSDEGLVGHVFWHNEVMGFCMVLPDVVMDVGCNDSFTGYLVRKKIALRGEDVREYLTREGGWKWRMYEKRARDVYFDLVSKHPGRVVGVYLRQFAIGLPNTLRKQVILQPIDYLYFSIIMLIGYFVYKQEPVAFRRQTYMILSVIPFLLGTILIMPVLSYRYDIIIIVWSFALVAGFRFIVLRWNFYQKYCHVSGFAAVSSKSTSMTIRPCVRRWFPFLHESEFLRNILSDIAILAALISYYAFLILSEVKVP